MSKYPEIDDPKFGKKIDNAFAQFQIPKKPESFNKFCWPEKYELQVPQQFVANYINPKTPYRGLLMYHKIGAGKSCAAIQIAEKFKNKSKILFVVPASLIGNIMSEIRSSCTGNEYVTVRERKLLATLPPSTQEWKDLVAKIDKKIGKIYNVISYNKFVRDLDDLNLNNTLIIIDEVHNMISETGASYKTIARKFDEFPDTSRLVIMTATPIYDKPNELALTVNLFLDENNKLPTGSAFNARFITLKNKQFTAKNTDEIKEKLTGLVSYYSGAPTYTYPATNMKFVKVKMSNRQYNMYRKIVPVDEEQKSFTAEFTNSFLISTRIVSNIVFRNGDFGKPAFESMRTADWKIGKMAEFSPKFVKIFNKMKQSPGPIFVYSNFREYGGITSFAKFLTENGWSDYAEHGTGENTFALWTSEQKGSEKDEVKAVFNNKNNANGSKIRVILGSPSIKEGVSLLRVRQVHLLESYWNMSRMSQVIGRAVRFCSHRDMPKEDRNVDIFIYVAVHPKIKNSVDERIVEMAQMKDHINKQFEKVVKEAAVDCRLFKNANAGERITCSL